jgi:hypothetical protein
MGKEVPEMPYKIFGKNKIRICGKHYSEGDLAPMII